MPRPKSDSRERIIEAARFLLSRNGYRGTGLAQIIERSGAPRGSVYFLFPGGKEQIVVEAVNALSADMATRLRQARAASPTAKVWLEGLADHFARALESSDFAEGLPVTTVTLDAVPDSKPLTDACRDAYENWLTVVAECLADYGVPASRCRDLAEFTLITLEGASILCRAYKSTDPIYRVAPYLVSLWDEK